MTDPAPAPLTPWRLGLRAAALFAVDPAGLAAVSVRAMPGPVRDRWLHMLRRLLPRGTPWRSVPLHVGDDRLLGGLDLPATLAAGRPVTRYGLLAEADGGILALPMAERISPGTAARIAAALDTAEVVAERDGLTTRAQSRIGVVLLDEGVEDETPPAALLERAAFRLDLTGLSISDAAEPGVDPARIADARVRLENVRAGEGIAEAIGGAALSLGVLSLRAPLACLRAARAAAALAGRAAVTEDDVTLAAALVLAPRATTLPAEADAPPADAAEPPPEQRSDSSEDQPSGLGTLPDLVVEAAKAAIPPQLLAALLDPARQNRGADTRSRSGSVRRSSGHGRPIGTRAGMPPRDGRLHVLETLRAAAPWQRLRGRAANAPLQVRRDDFRVVRIERRSGTTTIFVVDASGSSALNRLAEAKGAAELLLADCYARRDRVAVIAFRGRTAELLLPPTRALARAKRSLAGLPGGGGTPLAAGLEAAYVLADAARRHGDSAGVVVLTDGGANVALDGAPGRARAAGDAHAVATRLRAARVPSLLLDTAPRPHEAARRVADAMGARYLGLPYADPHAVSRMVRDLAG